MANKIHNESEGYSFLIPKIHKAVEYVADKILAENEKDVMEAFYRQYDPTEYDRSYEFARAWTWDDIQDNSTSVEAEFGFDGSTMEYDPGDFLHGSIYGDAREFLADIIYDGVWGDFFGTGPWQRKSRAFDILVNALDKSKFDKWMLQGFKKAGLYAVKV